MSQLFSSFTAFAIEYPSIPLAFMVVLLLFYTMYLHYKIYRFTKGQDAKSLESLIKESIDGVEEIQKRNELISKHALSLQEKVSHSLRNAHMIRYKAFETNGSNQSFSVALLNEQGNGVVLSSLHARDRISTFAKPVEKYVSEYDLTEEEKEVIKEAQSSHKKHM